MKYSMFSHLAGQFRRILFRPGIKIHITQDDINQGVRSSGLFCPVALAIRRAMKSPLVLVNDSILVTNQNASIAFQGLTYIIDVGAIHKFNSIPRKVQRFIHSFDKGYTVKPFKFRLSK